MTGWTVEPAHRRTAVALLVCAGALVRPCVGQCPDGSPPPCRATTSISGRVPALALNDNTWLVLPFENTTRAADADLIRQASVPQLYGEMSGWSGVRVISDDRVADLLHTLPEAQRVQIGLDNAVALARRVGAGRIVLGSYLALGGRATLTAKVYETRTRRELRVARSTLAGLSAPAALDSLTASFGRLARGLLDVPPGSGSASAGIGTSSMEAYRAYVAGMEAFNLLRIDSATIFFQRALAFDSNYALAHLAMVNISNDTAVTRPHIAAALRLAGSLPPRARALVEGAAASQRGDREGVCRAANELVGTDSSDADGWIQLVTCHIDPELEIVNGRPRLKGDFNQGLHAAQRAYALDPTSLNAAGAIIQAMQIGSYMICIPQGAVCPPDRFYRVSIMPPADSYVVAINLWRDVKAAPPDLAPAAVAAQAERYRRLLVICERLAQLTDTWIAHFVAGQIAMAGGNPQVADQHLGRGRLVASDTTTGNRTTYMIQRMLVALALERPADLNLWVDSLFPRTFPSPSTQQGYRSMMGRLAEGADTSVVLHQYAQWRSILVGVVPAGFDSLDRAIRARLTGPQLEDYQQLTTLAGFHLGYRGAELDTAARHPLKRYQAFFARGDVARARAALAEFDRELVARDDHTADDGGWLFSAESHAELGDSAVAFDRMREFGRRWPLSLNGPVILEDRYFQIMTTRLFGRAWLLYADLAKARSQNADARRAYRMVVALWEHGEPVVQPMVARAKAALAQPGS
jgi:hypothetical protein